VFEKGDQVRIAGEQGWYRVWRSELAADGSVLLYGGDKDPNGVQGFRSIPAEKLTLDKRKRIGK